MLYLGTENAIYVSFDDGRKWLPLQNNLPQAPVHHMVVQEEFNDLVVGTYGRGFWIMDDITPLQQMTAEVMSADAHLFQPRHAYRLHRIAGGPPTMTRATINYWLKDVPSGPVTVTVMDDRGRVVDTLRGPRRRGINRVTWDMRWPGGRQARLRTKPPGNPHVVEEKRFHLQWEREGWYPILSWGTYGGFMGYLVEPGTYTVQLNAGGEEYTRPLEIRKDPRSEGSAADIAEQVELQAAVRDDLNATSDLISRLEWMRKQLYDLRDVLREDGGHGDILNAVTEFDVTLRSIEDELLQHIVTEGDSKSFRYPQKLYCKLSVLLGDLNTLADFPPNQQHRDVAAVLHERLETQKYRFREMLRTELPAFNRRLQESGIGGIIAPEIKK